MSSPLILARFSPCFATLRINLASRACGALVSAVLALASSALAAPKPGWIATDIGSVAPGMDSYSGTGTAEKFVLTGYGFGPAVGGDKLKFTSTSVSGDFQFTARLLSISGSDGRHAGISVRQDLTGTSPYMAAACYVPNINSDDKVKNRPNTIGLYLRKPTVPDTWYSIWNPTDLTVSSTNSCWLRIIRKGNDLVMYKSDNGNSNPDDPAKRWSPIYNTSGGAFVVSGTVQVGLYVASGTNTDSTTGTFDNISLVTGTNAANLPPYKNSWLGNTFAASSTGYVSGNAKAMWVSPDGRCYVNGAGDEAGQSAKIYQSGTIVKRFDNPPSGGGWEGSITGNYSSPGVGNVFLTGMGGIFMTDLNGSNPKRIYISNPSVVNNLAQVSGLAWGNGQLYISNPTDGLIYITGTTRISWGTQSPAMSNVVYSGAIALSGSNTSLLAPPEVYQSQFQGSLLTYDISGLPLDPPEGKISFSVRLHFAEFGDDGASRTMKLVVSGTSLSATGTMVDGFCILNETGTKGVGMVKEFSGVNSVSGTIRVTVSSTNADFPAVINGIQVSWPGDTLEYNCGGPKVVRGSEIWNSSINEKGRINPAGGGVRNPGPLAVDNRGDLWIVQEGGPFPTSTGKFDVPVGQASIVCYSGTAPFVPRPNKAIHGLTNPTAMCYDATNDRLLVTEDGVEQNIHIYTGLSGTTAPVCSGTFGAVGGVFSGSNAGFAYDPSDHKDARFYGPTGIGIDSANILYVVCNSGPNITDLKAFKPATTGTLPWLESARWKWQGLEFCNVGDFDPSGNEPAGIWTPSHHYTMDYTAATGAEWTLRSYLWNPFLITGTWSKTEPRSSGVTAVMRRVAGKNYMYTSGQGTLMYNPISGSPLGMDVFRFQGEQLIRCAEITWHNNNPQFWADSSPYNGIEEPAEIVNGTAPTANGGAPTCFDVGPDGAVYFAVPPTGYHTTSYVWKLACTMGPGGPSYSSSDPNNKMMIIPASSHFSGTGWGAKAHLRYFASSDTMYLEGERVPRPDPNDDSAKGNFGGVVECWTTWSGTPSLKFSSTLPDPSTEATFQNGKPPYQQPDGFCYEAMDVCRGYTFISDNWGSILVLEPAQGHVITKLIAGPEVGGVFGWCDAIMGLRAHYNADRNEFEVLQECAGFHIRQNLYRWTPPSPPPPD